MAKFQFKYVYYLLIKFSTASFVTLCHCEIEFKGFFTQQGESEPQQNGSHHGGDRDEIDDEDEGEVSAEVSIVKEEIQQQQRRDKRENVIGNGRAGAKTVDIEKRKSFADMKLAQVASGGQSFNFEDLVEEVEFLGDFFYDNPKASPSEIGDRCFDEALEAAREK